MRIPAIVSKGATLMCALFLSTALLASCTTTSEEQTDAASLNRAYMSNVNRISNEAAEDLESFIEAADQGNLAAMRIAAANATETLSKISSLTAPDALLEVHEEYLAGVEDLSQALEDYVELYASAVNSSDDESAASVDEEALAQIQATYQSGVDHLAEADAMVAAIAGEDGTQTEDGTEG